VAIPTARCSSRRRVWGRAVSPLRRSMRGSRLQLGLDAARRRKSIRWRKCRYARWDRGGNSEVDLESTTKRPCPNGTGSSEALNGWNTKPFGGRKPVAVHRPPSAGSARKLAGVPAWSPALCAPLSPNIRTVSGLNDISVCRNTPVRGDASHGEGKSGKLCSDPLHQSMSGGAACVGTHHRPSSAGPRF